MASIIDGKAISEQILKESGEEVTKLRQNGLTPGLAAVLVGDNPASQVYVRNKTKSCEQIGMFAETIRMPKESPQEAVVQKVRGLNRDPRFHGILVQLPLPSHIDEGTVVNTVAPEKDADGLTAASMGRLALGEPIFVPATAAGIQQLLLRTGHDPEGKHVVICGRSNIVSKPLALLLVQKAKGANATVTMCHTRTKDIASFTRQADILVVSTGVAQWVKGDMVKPGAVVIDVGINRINDPTTKSGTRLVGDVDFASVSTKAAAITPVPGGVGPMTVAMLVASTVKAAAHSLKAR
ncbi:MAG: bifunctional 5,10-methylene-tetrahydrofolate dehydrogenase/5,10-methylene-tetrahydrofolate cyclohydrolase [Chloroflexi bacterium]|nr:bifunctional 5,10-methylene-tetrahydrofolate dehydrogenase/5,10-methylene-tetrahydrofolate cyclohydrolase [Chloroflexota bacterium]